MRDYRDNSLLGIQTIQLVDNEWEKRMLSGMRAKGAILRIGPQWAAETFFCEGYVTGLSIDAALRLARLNASVMVCFSASNLTFVAKAMTGTRFVVADNDVSLTGERAALATGLPYCMSEAVGEDVNDLHRRAGVMAVAKLLMEVRHAKS
jgi:putative DNA primase/helicase